MDEDAAENDDVDSFGTIELKEPYTVFVPGKEVFRSMIAGIRYMGEKCTAREVCARFGII